MDLVEIYISKRIKIAQRIDRGEITEAEGTAESKKAYEDSLAAERSLGNPQR
jgi:hypothetical protein